MKVSYISRSDTWNDQQVIREAEKMGIDLQKTNLDNLNNTNLCKSLGDVVLWRSSLLEPRSGRTTVLSALDKEGKFIINRSLIDYPAVIFKQFQQEYIKSVSSNIKTIPTFTFLNKEGLKEGIESKVLKFPFIKKPNLGAKGEGIKLIKKIDDLELLEDDEVFKSVFQNFIKNDGDYRVLVIGGKPIGTIKRVGEEGSFVNNVSMGGEALLVDDGRMKIEMFKIAAQVAATFNLGFCGVDIIQDLESKELYFLELNTVPQWEGFQKCTGINVARELLQYCQSAASRKSQDISELVKDCYINNIDKLANRKFHFLTRMFLWTDDEKYLEGLNELKSKYYGKNKDDFEKIIQGILDEKDIYQKRIYNKKDFRVESADKYPLLGAYSELLFRNLMSKNIFGEDLKPVLEKFMSDEELLAVRSKLTANKQDLLNLSTFAINFLYFLEDYLSEKRDAEVDVEKLLELTRVGEFGDSNKEAKIIMNDIYFITHIIIGASKFYKNNIVEKRDLYLELFKTLERIVKENYFKLSLDTKLELLVCAKLLNTESTLENMIRQEVDLSLSPINNFLVDTVNAKNGKSSKSWLGSEHRNVLYIMLNVKNKY